MTDVYVVTGGWDEDCDVTGVFSTRENAKLFVPNPRYRFIEKHTVDGAVEPHLAGLCRWEVTIDVSGKEAILVEELEPGECCFSSKHECYSGGTMYCVYAKDRNHAVTLALVKEKERRGENE